MYTKYTYKYVYVYKWIYKYVNFISSTFYVYHYMCVFIHMVFFKVTQLTCKVFGFFVLYFPIISALLFYAHTQLHGNKDKFLRGVSQ